MIVNKDEVWHQILKNKYLETNGLTKGYVPHED
jgi:hypothetical protein